MPLVDLYPRNPQQTLLKRMNSAFIGHLMSRKKAFRAIWIAQACASPYDSASLQKTPGRLPDYQFGRHFAMVSPNFTLL